MSISINKITSAQLTASAATYYTSPTNGRGIIKKLTFTNSTATARTITVYLVPSAGSAGATNIITDGVTVPAHSTYECFEAEGQTLLTGQTLQALSDSATAVTIAGTVAEIYG